MTIESDDIESETLNAAARLLADAQRLLVLSGAGISAESGIPTFREAQTGLWAQYAPEDLATPEAFDRNPERVWAWYQWRRTLIARGGANAGHHALAELESYFDITIATQNVDGLHRAAGSTTIAELHGSIWRDRCRSCHYTTDVDIIEPIDDRPRYCTRCHTMSRPDVVWFGERLPVEALEMTENALTRADAVIVVGTSNQVYPAAAFVDRALDSSTPVIEINPATTTLSQAANIHLASSAAIALPELGAALDAIRASR